VVKATHLSVILLRSIMSVCMTETGTVMDRLLSNVLLLLISKCTRTDI
jgi:hypothetical protein